MGLILGYIWRANSRLTKRFLEGEERLRKGMALMVKDVHEGQKVLMEGQREMAELPAENIQETLPRMERVTIIVITNHAYLSSPS